MAYRRGDFVKYEGSIQRLHGTWWTVAQTTRSRNRVVSYTLENRLLGQRLRNVSPEHVNQNREDEAC